MHLRVVGARSDFGNVLMYASKPMDREIVLAGDVVGAAPRRSSFCGDAPTPAAPAAAAAPPAAASAARRRPARSASPVERRTAAARSSADTDWRSASTSCASDPMRTLLSSTFSRTTRTSFASVVDRPASDRRAPCGWRSVCSSSRALTALIASFSVSDAEQVLQLLRLLLQHADVGHHLLVFLVGGDRRRGSDERRRAPGEQHARQMS